MRAGSGRSGSGRSGGGRQPQPNVVLVGFMGTGKSAVGRALARRLGRRLFDTDAWITAQAAMPIPALFAEFGETAFRDLETQAAEEVARPQSLVVATGGGILGRDENLAALRRGGVLICLHARPEVILARTAPWESRPMLRSAPDPAEAVAKLLAERAPRYALADWAVDTSELEPPEVAERICERLPSLFPVWSTRSASAAG
jgi:shikimate kinase